LKIKCVNDLVSGLTKDKEYDIINIFVRMDGITFGLIDDYGTYNEFRHDRFIFMDDQKIDALFKSNGISISVFLH
jgi:hypothetical protein